MINDLWLETYDKASSTDKAQLSRCINNLLARTFLLSESYDEATGLMKGNSDYRLVDRYFEWLHDYLAIAGWELLKDRNLGVIYIENNNNQNRLQLGSMATLILLTLRLLYDEEREKLTLRQAVQLTVADVVDRLLVFNTLKRKPSDKDLLESFRLLSRYNIVQKLAGEWTEANCQFLVLPSIALVLAGEVIGRIYQTLLAGEAEEEGDSGREIQLTDESLADEPLNGEEL